MAGPVDAFLKLSVAVSLLGAAGSVGYYYSVYLPARDAQLESERSIESANRELARQAQEQAQLAAQQAREQQSAAQKAAIRGRYQSCINNADANYQSNWALNCKEVAERQVKNRAQCLTGGLVQKATCDSLYPTLNANENCSLPRAIADDLNKDRRAARDMCLREVQAGLQ